MSRLKLIKSLITNPGDRMYFLSAHGFYHNMSDEEYLRRMWRYRMGGALNLDNPKTLSEKLQWLKIHDRNPEYHKYADKYEIKKIVSDLIGEDHVIPLYGVWNSFDEIDFDSLPDRFILKTTHDSGTFMICRDKTSFDYKKARKKFTKALKRNYYWSDREWVYKDIKPRIIAEEYIPSLGSRDSVEYKITCMNDEVKFTTICTGIAHSAYEKRTNDHFDRDFNRMPWYAYYKPSKTGVQIPDQMDEILEYATNLCRGIPYVRVDFYIVDGRVYFGEMTFYTWAGFIKFDPPEWDRKLGDMLILPGENI